MFMAKDVCKGWSYDEINHLNKYHLSFYRFSISYFRVRLEFSLDAICL